MLGAWATAGHGTLAGRLAHWLRVAVDAGVLADGARLPAERTLATSLAGSRSTLGTAFDELRADGYIVSRQGSGSRVRGPRSRAVAGGRMSEHFADVSGIDLAVGNPADGSHLPDISIDVADLTAYGGGPGIPALGLPALRLAVADRFTERGLLTDPEQIHITAGAHQAISLTMAALAGDGGIVAVEDPSYPGLYDILEAIGAPCVLVAADDEGLRPDALERVLTERSPRALYLQNGPHNPTGRLASPARIRALAEVLDRHDTAVFEDLALADLAFEDRPTLLFANACRRAVVVSAGSISKVGWSGLRIGWLRAPAPLVERTKHLHLASGLGTSVPSQLHRSSSSPTTTSWRAGGSSRCERRPSSRSRGWPERSPSGRSARPAAARCCGRRRRPPTPGRSCNSRTATACASRRAPPPPPGVSRDLASASASIDPTISWRKGSVDSRSRGAST